jgi:hypothetical protein
MESNTLLALLDAEISRLQQARTLLAEFEESTEPLARTPHRTNPKRKKKRKLSPEGRARIVEALKRRWAGQRSKQKGEG